MVRTSTPASRSRPQPRPSLRRTLTRVGFWGAVVSPLGYLPLLYGGLDGAQTTLLSVLLGLHALCLVLGRGYGQ